MDYRAQTFRGCRVRLDDNQFLECTFEDVVFEYGGGPIHFHNNDVRRFTIEIDGALGNGLEGLRTFCHAAGPKTVKSVVDTVSGFLRKPTPPATFTIG